MASKTASSSSSSHAFQSTIKFAQTCSSVSTFMLAAELKSGVYLKIVDISTDVSLKHDGGGATWVRASSPWIKECALSHI